MNTINRAVGRLLVERMRDRVPSRNPVFFAQKNRQPLTGETLEAARLYLFEVDR